MGHNSSPVGNSYGSLRTAVIWQGEIMVNGEKNLFRREQLANSHDLARNSGCSVEKRSSGSLRGFVDSVRLMDQWSRVTSGYLKIHYRRIG